MVNLLAILTFVVIGWFWLDSLRAREMATEICREACKQRHLQLLDQTVVLRHLGLKRTSAGLRWRRVYGFDFSEEGIGRRRGYLILIGLNLETISIDLPAQPADA